MYYPSVAQRAAEQASTARAHYHQAVQAIRQKRIPGPEKQRQLRELHVVHQRRMQEHQAAWHNAFLAAERGALKRLMSDPTIRGHRITMDSYLGHLRRLDGKPIKELEAEYDLASLLDNDVLMRAAAMAALNQRMPDVPGDAATRLVARFAYEQEPDGHGRLRRRFPETADAWDTLLGLEAWTATDRMNATGVFSTPSTPEKPTDPTPRDPREAARAAVAELYPTTGQASSEPPAAS